MRAAVVFRKMLQDKPMAQDQRSAQKKPPVRITPRWLTIRVSKVTFKLPAQRNRWPMYDTGVSEALSLPSLTHPTIAFRPATSTVPMLDFSRQFSAHRDELMQAIESVCTSQRFILGPQVELFEQAAALACAVPHAIGCASGTDALWLAFAAANIGDNGIPNSTSTEIDVILTTPFSFFASASSILRAGARPVFADIDPLTFNLSPDAATEVLLTTPNCRAILPVHLFGQCADWDAFTAIQQQNPGLLLIEDAAQAFGATWNEIPAGALGDAAAFSFYPTKNLSAFGDAGLMATRSTIIDTHARSLRAHGMTRRYFHDEIGWNSRLDTLQAAVLSIKLKYLAGWNQRRRELAARYDELFLVAGIAVQTAPDRRRSIADGVVLPWTDPRAGHVFHQYVIRAPQRDDLRTHLAARGIGSEVYYPLCLHQQKALAFLGYRAGDFPEAERAAAEVLALPIYPELRDDEQQTVVDAVRAFYAG
jgi:dTDP-4-amino-4,6-dideoxygalactose transaminase